MSVDGVVSPVGLWWPAADEDVLFSAADAWGRAAAALDRAGAAGLDGAARAGSTWSGASAEAFDRAWRDHAGALRDDAAGCRALARALRTYADAVADAKRRVEELAVTAGATLVAGLALAWVTFGTSVAAAGGLSASLVAAAAAVGVELSATAAAITAGAVVGVTFGAAEAAFVDGLVIQPLRVEVFDDGGYSVAEVGAAAALGGVGGGLGGGVAAGVAAAPVARTAAGDLAGLRAPGGVIRAALDPPNWGPQLGRFRVGVHEGPGARFQPHERPTADLLAGENRSVHARPVIEKPGIANPDTLVRNGPRDPGTYTEFKRPQAMTSGAVKNEIMKAGKQLDGYGGGELVLDGRTVGLTEEVARQALARALGQSASHGSRLPTTIRLVLGDGRSIHHP